MKTKKVWAKFYWGDYQGDPKLRVCSLAAQGLWMQMLCLAAESFPIGYVMVANRPCMTADLSRLTGEQNCTIDAYITELETNGVFSRTKDGTIYSRRMVRDEKKARIARQNGKKGGSPSLGNEKGNPPWVNPQDKPPDKPQRLEARGYKSPNGDSMGRGKVAEIDERWRAWKAENAPAVADLERELASYRDWQRANGKRVKDETAGFKNWLRRADKWAKPTAPSLDFAQQRSEREADLLRRMEEKYG